MRESIIGKIIDKVLFIEEKMKNAASGILGCEEHDLYHQAWYRGISDCSYELIPNIYRNDFSYTKLREKEMIDIFETYIPMFLKKANFLEFKHDFELYFVAQHYGLKTRLLDWTKSLISAIYFAVQNYKHNSNINAAIWVLNPSLMNYLFHSCDYPLIPSNENISNYWFSNDCLPEFPLAIYPIANNERILAQQGVFTIFGNENNSLENIIKKYLDNNSDKYKIKISEDDIIFKIVIENNEINKIKKELNILGINHVTEFPELQSVSRYINEDFSDNT
nr:hypothetical protein GTC16762_11510 [Pigmentibacter ruber]